MGRAVAATRAPRVSDTSASPQTKDTDRLRPARARAGSACGWGPLPATVWSRAPSGNPVTMRLTISLEADSVHR